MNFISKYDIDKDKLTKYLLDTQKNKSLQKLQKILKKIDIWQKQNLIEI